MITKQDVEQFLSAYYQKVRVFGIVFRDERGKNAQALLDLDITPRYREDIVRSLTVDDYVAGPIADTLNKNGEMWVFGKDVKGREVYIKITMGRANNPVICISFHIAEGRLKYIFR